ncbi:MAG: nickel-dependent lactate racemase [Anaerolineae bacterium]
MSTFQLPYDHGTLTLHVPNGYPTTLIAPRQIAPAPDDPGGAVRRALDAPIGDVALSDFAGARSAAIAINDKTRPVPHEHLLPPLLARLDALGLGPDAVTLIIATGAHAPMPPSEFARVVPPEILARYPVISHDCDAEADLVYLGQTARGTPAWIHRAFAEADLRIVVGNIEPHQFEGFSGGVKSAVIGLGGRATINANHAMLTHPKSALARYADNPARRDLEELGRLAEVHLALNVVLTPHKEIVRVLFGAPVAVMEAGIPWVREIYEVPVAQPCDLVVVAPGGAPKDLNLYQAQKALAHASRVTKEGGAIILVAACPEGIGSRGYERWMLEGDVQSYDDVFAKFEREGFRVGPHKAVLIARDASRLQGLWLVSALPPDLVRRLLLTPATLEAALAEALVRLPPGARVGVMPLGNATVPFLA